MTYRNIPSPFPSFPEIASETHLSAQQVKQIRYHTSGQRRLDAYNRFRPSGEKNKYGNDLVCEADAIIISDAHIPGLDESITKIPGTELHCAFRDDKHPDRLFGLLGNDKHKTGIARSGIVGVDKHGRGWFRDDEAPDVIEPVSLKLPENVKMFDLRGEDLIRHLPVSGKFDITYQEISAIHDFSVGDNGHEIDVLINQQVDREERIAEIIDRFVTREQFAKILDTLTFPRRNDVLIPNYNDKERRPFEDALNDLSRRVLIGLRDAGLCAPCPNNGPRNVSAMNMWNTFMSGVVDKKPKDDSPFEHLKAYSRISMLPACKAIRDVLRKAYIAGASTLGENSFWTREQAEDNFALFKSLLIRTFKEEEEGYALADTLQGSLDGQTFKLNGSFLRPVLSDPMDPLNRPLPVIDEPKMIRHLTLTLPTGRLAMADWFRVKGFTEGMKILSNEADEEYDINYADGLNQRAQAYYEQTGLVIVQVGNTSPNAYADGEGVWRMGQIFEDDLYDDDGKRKTNSEDLEPLWETCTDLWANVFGSPEAVIKVLMASGEYDNESDAENALASYCDEAYGANIIDLRVNKIHVYAPTGYAENTQDEIVGVGKGILSDDDFREDKYVLSAKELPIEAGLLSDEVWEEKKMETGLSDWFYEDVYSDIESLYGR